MSLLKSCCRSRGLAGAASPSGDDGRVEMRAFTLRTHQGERVVLTARGRRRRVPALDDLGMSDHLARSPPDSGARRKRRNDRWSGPGGSGRSTTAAAARSISVAAGRKPSRSTTASQSRDRLASTTRRYFRDGVGLTYASALRSILPTAAGRRSPRRRAGRRWPRPRAAEAARPGKLVLGLVAGVQDSAAAIVRLRELGVDPSLTVARPLRRRIARAWCGGCARAAAFRYSAQTTATGARRSRGRGDGVFQGVRLQRPRLHRLSRPDRRVLRSSSRSLMHCGAARPRTRHRSGSRPRTDGSRGHHFGRRAGEGEARRHQFDEIPGASLHDGRLQRPLCCPWCGPVGRRIEFSACPELRRTAGRANASALRAGPGAGAGRSCPFWRQAGRAAGFGRPDVRHNQASQEPDPSRPGLEF